MPHGPIRKYYKGLYVGLDRWDGCDFFLPAQNLGIIVTQRVYETLKKDKVFNINLVNLAEIETSEFTVNVAMQKRNNGEEKIWWQSSGKGS